MVLQLLDQPVLLFIHLNVEKASFSVLSKPLAQVHFKHLMCSYYVPGTSLPTRGYKDKQGQPDVVFVLKRSHLLGAGVGAVGVVYEG